MNEKTMKIRCRGDQVQCGAGGLDGMVATTKVTAMLLELPKHFDVMGDAGAIGRLVGGGGDARPALDLKGDCTVCSMYEKTPEKGVQR